MDLVGGNVVEGELACFGCLYDLRGQSADGRCPECGQPVAASTREDRWDRADARWQRGVRRGFLWAAGEYAAVVAGWAGQVAWPDTEWILLLAFALMAVTGVVGGWTVTSAELTGRRDRSRMRWAIRGLTAAAGLACAGVVAAAVWTWDDVEVWGLPAGSAMMAVWCALNGAKQAALAWYARGLLVRVPGRPLRRSSAAWVAAPLVGWWGFVAAMVVNHLLFQTAVGWRLTVAMLLVVLAAFLATAAFDLAAWWVLRRAGR
jgi:hypothetical protein